MDIFRFLKSTAGQIYDAGRQERDASMQHGRTENIISQYDFDALPVVEGGTMLGIVTKFDFLRVFAFTTGQMVPRYDELMKRTVGDVMTKAWCTSNRRRR